MSKPTKAYLVRGLELVSTCLVAECDCLDPPEDQGTDPDDPSNHAQYCPDYLQAVIAATLSGKPFPA